MESSSTPSSELLLIPCYLYCCFIFKTHTHNYSDSSVAPPQSAFRVTHTGSPTTILVLYSWL
ncbi:hypothetical protein AB205_0168080, partial [Aquarana catesbeiana]